MFPRAWPVNLDVLYDAPLPLAQLGARALGEPSPRRRHDAAFCAADIFLKLQTALVIAEQTRRTAEAHTLATVAADDLLPRPHWDDWLQRLRRGRIALEQAGEPRFHLLATARLATLPACRELADLLRGLVAPGMSCKTLTDLVQLIGTYRNRSMAHSQAAPIDLDQVGRCLLLALIDLLATGRALADRRLVYVERAEQTAPHRWHVEHCELHGLAAVRLRPVELSVADPRLVPTPQQVYAIDRVALVDHPMSDEGAPAIYTPASCVALGPLLRFDPARHECYFGERATSGHPALTAVRYIGYLEGVTRTDDEPARDETPVAARGRSTVEMLSALGVRHRAALSNMRGDLEIVAVLARGQHTDVLRAWQSGVDRYVALKQLHEDAPEPAELVLRREWQLLMRVNDPGLLPVLAAGYEPSWFSMPLVEGPTLADLLDALRGFQPCRPSIDDYRACLQTAEGAARERERSFSRRAGMSARDFPLPVAAALSGEIASTYAAVAVGLIARLAAAVDACHGAGFVLGNLHPAHVLIDLASGRPRLIDLGSAAEVAGPVAVPFDRAVRLIAPYLAPEQLGWQRQHSRATDLYLLGVMLWELLTLRPLFDLDAAPPKREIELRIRNDVPASLRHFDAQIPARLDDVVLACLAKNPARRPASAAELAAVLDDCANELARVQRGPRLSLLWSARRRPS